MKGGGRGFAPVGDTRIYYEVAGRGEPVVLLHGGLLDTRMWDAQWAPFAARFRVGRFDARGFGGSALTAAAFSNYEDLAGLLDYLGIERAHLVGLSLGGQTAINLALTYPQRVRSLVLVGPGLSGFDFPGDDSGQRWWDRVNAAVAGDLGKATELWLADPYMAPAMRAAGARPATAPDRRREPTGVVLARWKASGNRGSRPEAHADLH